MRRIFIPTLISIMLLSTSLFGQGKYYKLEVDQEVVNGQLMMDIYITKTNGSDFALAASNFSLYVDPAILDIPNMHIDHNYDGPWDFPTAGATHYWEMSEGRGSNYINININSKTSAPAPTASTYMVSSTRTRIGRLVIPVLDQSACNSVSWRIAPVEIHNWDQERIKSFGEFIPPPACMPLCNTPDMPLVSAATSGTPEICPGESTQLVSSYSGSHRWFRNGVEIPNKTSGTIDVDQIGTYTAIATNYSCQSQTSNIIQVSYFEMNTPVISTLSNTVVCEGEPTILTSDYTGGNKWYMDGVEIAGANTSNYQVTEIGKHTYTAVSNQGSCASDFSNSISITVNALPVKPTVTLVNGDQLTSDVTTNIQWLLNGNPIPGATQQNITMTENGEYSVISINDCGTSESDRVKHVSTGIANSQFEGSSFNVFPNPYVGHTNIVVKLASDADLRIEVLNDLGQKVSTIVDGNVSKGDHSYKFGALKQGLAAGTYFIKYYVNDQTYSTKVIELKR